MCAWTATLRVTPKTEEEPRGAWRSTLPVPFFDGAGAMEDAPLLAPAGEGAPHGFVGDDVG